MEEEKFDRLVWRASCAAVVLGVVFVLVAVVCGVLLVVDVLAS